MRSGMIKRSKVGNHISQSTRFVAPTAVDAPFSDSGAFDSAEIQGRPVCSAMNGKDFAAYESAASAHWSTIRHAERVLQPARGDAISRGFVSRCRGAARRDLRLASKMRPSLARWETFIVGAASGGTTDLANERHHRVARSRRTRRGSHLSRARAAYVLSSPVEAFCRDSQHDLLGDLLHEARGRRYVIDGLSNFQ